MVRGHYPLLELIQPAVQRPDALQDQRAVGRRVSLAISRFRLILADTILPCGLIVFAGSRHSTSVAGYDNRPAVTVRYPAMVVDGRRDWILQTQTAAPFRWQSFQIRIPYIAITMGTVGIMGRIGRNAVSR